MMLYDERILQTWLYGCWLSAGGSCSRCLPVKRDPPLLPAKKVFKAVSSVRASAVGVLTAGPGTDTEKEIDLEGSATSSAPRQHTGRCSTPPNRGDYTENNGIANTGLEIADLVWNVGFYCLYLNPGDC